MLNVHLNDHSCAVGRLWHGHYLKIGSFLVQTSTGCTLYISNQKWEKRKNVVAEKHKQYLVSKMDLKHKKFACKKSLSTVGLVNGRSLWVQKMSR
jgi:hypothetical protein